MDSETLKKELGEGDREEDEEKEDEEHDGGERGAV